MTRLGSAGSLVDARGLRRTYTAGATTVEALDGAGLVINPGDRIALTGRSGSGKSTLLHLIAGLDAPTGGSIIWPALGQFEELRPRHIGLVMQSPSLIPWLTVAENIALPLQLDGSVAADGEAAAREALAEFQLEEIAGKLPEEISGGQAQRVSLVRATITQPALLLADEPTGQLDHVTASALLNVLFHWAERTGAAVVVATHDRLVADRFPVVLSMEYGRLVPAPEWFAS
jgi:putative ABC transport system ATP-binding protein/lipoprotein-releasing system ATP-binding protein